MQVELMKQRLERIEEYADEAKQAVKAATVPDELRQSIESLHQHASEAKRNPLMDHALYRETVEMLEELADDAMEACRDAGGGVDPQVLHAVRRAHGELVRMREEVLARA